VLVDRLAATEHSYSSGQSDSQSARRFVGSVDGASSILR